MTTEEEIAQRADITDEKALSASYTRKKVIRDKPE